MSTEEIDSANKEIAKQGILLSLPASYWEQFIRGSEVDGEALLAAGYNGDGQVEWLTQEIRARGWLGGEATYSELGPIEAALAKAKEKRAEASE